MTSNLPRFMEYMKIIGQLKRVQRTGWVHKGVKNPESVADHMYRMAMVAFTLPSDSGLDRDKCIKIALVHDMAESMVGDITPWCGVNKEEKNRREEAATSHIADLVPGEGGQEMYNLWLEYETQSSPEAKFVKDLDKLEMLFQAYEYEKLENKPKSLQEFYDHTKAKHTFSTVLVHKWCTELELERDKIVDDMKWKSPNAEMSSPSSKEGKKKKETFICSEQVL